ncbi:hypothetical protein KUTeg_024733 [Tegillarca granosa]|uniref:Uncharacterized protein n=1 Tax=Tegillarca granosa TaxID=220873 RepID=A0ABQ9E2V7_TEGGR|nr:hypothetical protein KUTeg_024733 [Tegillarca granosa]
MAVLVIVYMHDCYNNVYDSYLTFNKTIIEDVMDRVEDLKKVASLPSSMQENAGFQDLIVEKDEPEEDDNASIKSGIGSDKENLESRKQSLTTICEQTELGKPHGKSPNNEGSEEKEKEKSNDKKDGGDKKDIPIEKVLEKYIKDGVEKRNFLEKQELTRDRGSNGIPLGDSTKKLLPRLSIIEDNFVDLFIDLGVADAANHWHIYGSSETIPSASMLPDSDTPLQKYRNTDYLPPPYTSGMQEIPEIKVDHVD